MNFKPRDYQVDLSDKVLKILNEKGVAYLAAEVRTGKTFTSLMAADKYGAKKVLFFTVKKAISGIEDDVKTYGKLSVDVVSIDSAHKIPKGHDYDFVIVDEAHGLGAYPKPSRRAKNVKQVVRDLPVILMSGTPSPESYSQLYHQFYVSKNSPFRSYSTFYKWAKDFVDVTERVLAQGRVKDYSQAKRGPIMTYCEDLFVDFTQKEAGFECEVTEHDVIVTMKPNTKSMLQLLAKNNVIYDQYADGPTILADTAVKMMSKLHQISSGTVIVEEGYGLCFDTTKVEYIKEHFAGKKLAIFYKYDAERAMLQDILGNAVTRDLDEFNSTDKSIILQIKAGSTGINLSKADLQVFLNVDFSSKDYQQAKARLQTQKRKQVDVYFLLSDCGIDQRILRMVRDKRTMTSSYFKKYIK